jgi:hypothetical protein
MNPPDAVRPFVLPHLDGAGVSSAQLIDRPALVSPSEYSDQAYEPGQMTLTSRWRSS